MINIHDEKIHINHQDTFIYGGELHYFRVPKEEWRDRVHKIKEAGCNMISTYIPWIWHEPVEGEIDLTGITRGERDLQGFLELLQEEQVLCLVRPGPYVMAELRQEGLPGWVIEKYPEIIATTKEDNLHPCQVVSYMHPKFLSLVATWYEAVCELIKPYQISDGGPVAMFQLDNEVAMLQWVTNEADYSPITLQYFEEFLQNKYKTLEAFMKLYKVKVSSFNDFTMNYTKNCNRAFAPLLQHDWGMFMRSYHRKYLETLKDMAKDNGIHVPFVVNIHGFNNYDLSKRGDTYPIGISQLYEAAKIEDVILAGDYYIGNINYDNFHDLIIANAFTKAVQQEHQPLFSAEFQGGCLSDQPRLQPSAFELNTRICVAHGMNALNYYMFAGGENYEGIGLFGRRHEWQAPISTNGHLRKHYHHIAYLGKMFKAFEKEILSTKKVWQTHIGFYPDYYMTEYTNDYTQEMNEKIKTYRDDFGFNGIIKGLSTVNIPYEGYDVQRDEEIPVGKVPSLWMLTTEWMSADVQKKLLHYVREGGKLILYPTVPTKDFGHQPCTILRDGLGLKVINKRHTPHEINVKGMDSILVSYSEAYEKNGLQVFAQRDEVKGEAVAFSKSIDKGQVVVYGAGMKLDYYHKKQVVLHIADEIDLNPRLQQSDDFLEVVIRQGDQGQRFVFIHNYDEYIAATTVTYENETLFGGREIKVPARSGVMLPINVKVHEDVFIHHSTSEIYDINESDEEIILSLHALGKDELILSSEVYKPQNSEAIRVIEKDHTYQVLLLNENEKIDVILKKEHRE